MTGDDESAQGVAELLAEAEPVDELDEQTVFDEVERELFGRSDPPLTVGRYVLLERIGSGGGGIVHAAYDTELNRRVAVKLLRARVGAEESEGQAEARLVAEAQAMAQVSHPNVIAVYDMGRYDLREQGSRLANASSLPVPRRGVYLVMELIEGVNLREWLAKKRRKTKDIIDVFLAAGRGLAAAHRKGLVHRDFKPANVLVAPGGEVRVLDFGLALGVEASMESTPQIDGASVSPGSANPGSGSAVVGTPPYMSPEQHRVGPIDQRSDQFNFCVSLYEALFRQRPFEGNTLESLVHAKESGKIPARSDGPRVPNRVFKVLRRGLEPQPEARFESMDALVEALAPSRRGGRLVALAVATMGLGLSLVWASDEESPCDKGRASIEASWNPKRGLALQDGLVGSGVPYASDNTARVLAELEAYAQSWRKTYDLACQAARVDRVVPLTDFELQAACLERSRLELDALVGALATTGERGLERAVAAVEGLHPLESCVDAQRLRAHGAAIELTEAPIVADLQGELARGRALELTGQIDAARDLAVRVAAAAQGGGSPATGARALFFSGRIARLSGDLEGAESALRQAFRAATMSKSDQLAARVGVELTGVLAQQARFTAADEWADRAEVAILRVGGDPSVEVDLLEARALLARREGKGARAEKIFSDAVTRRSQLPGEQRLALARLVRLQAEVTADAQTSVDLRARAMEHLVARLGDEHPTVARHLVDLSTPLVRQGELTLAREHLERAMAIYTSCTTPGPVLADLYDRLANLARQEGRTDDARAYEDKASSAARSEAAPVPAIDASACHPPDVLILLDHSVAMGKSPVDGKRVPLAESKLEAGLEALAQTIAVYGDRAHFGLVRFPDDSYCSGCLGADGLLHTERLCRDPGAVLEMDPQLESAAAFAELRGQPRDLCCGTPTIKAMTLAGEVLHERRTPGRQAVVLITDGMHHCGSYLHIVERFASEGIATYPLGFANVRVEYSETLNDVACAAKTAPDFPDGCYEADGVWRAAQPAGRRLYELASKQSLSAIVADLLSSDDCSP